MVQQKLEQLILYSCTFRMHARRYLSQSRAWSGGTVRPIGGIHLGSSFEEDCRKLNSILCDSLTVALHSIGSHILQQRRLMLSRRTRTDQTRILAQQLPKPLRVA